LKADLPASIVVFLVALPLCMGIAIASGVPVASGLITGIVGGIVVGLIGGAPLQVSGPAAGLTVVVYGIVQEHGLAAFGVIVLAAGLLQVLAGLLRMGQWFRAVSPAVIHGMLAGIGVLIFASQFHVMVDDTPKKSGIENLLTIPEAIAKGLPLPEPSTADERQARSELLKSIDKLHARQSAIQESIVARTSVAAAEQNASAQQVLDRSIENQRSVTRAIRSLEASIGEKPIGQTQRSEIERAAALAVQNSEEALSNLVNGAPATNVQESQHAALASMEELKLQLKSHQWAAKVGLLTILALLLWQSFAPQRVRFIPAPLVAVVLASAIAYFLSLPVLSVRVPDNLWMAIRFPSWSIFESGDVASLLQAAVVIALIASAETLLCATAVDKMHGGRPTNYDRELVGQGVGNSICGLLGALPMTGVIVRSATNVQAGARSRLSAVLHGVWLLIFVSALVPVLRAIPISTLAAILVYTGYKLVNPKQIKELKNYGWGEVAIYLATLIMIVVTDLLTGVLTGVALSAAKLLYTFSHLDTSVETDAASKRTVLSLVGAATFLRLPRLAAALEKVPANAELHVDLQRLDYIDHACIDLLMSWAKCHEASGGSLVVDWNSLHAQFRRDTPQRQKSVA
jgi:MFS superfamily sulfate permease-like transporter